MTGFELQTSGIEATLCQLSHTTTALTSILVLSRLCIRVCSYFLLPPHLLRLVVGRVGRVASLAVTVVALDDVVVLRLLHHDHLVDATFAGGRNRADVQRYVAAEALPRKPNDEGLREFEEV